MLSDTCFNGFTGSDSFVDGSGHNLIKSPACRSVSDLVQLFKPVEIVNRDDLKQSSPACRSVSDLVKLFEPHEQSLSARNLSTQNSKSTFGLTMENHTLRIYF